MMQGPSAEPLSRQKRTAQPVYPIFTSSPTSASFKRPIFKDKVPGNTRQHLETTNPSQHNVQQQSSSAQKESEVSCFGFAVSSENKVEPCNLALGPSTITTPPCCERERASADNPNEDEMDEDQTIFFTPELFEGKGDEGSPQKETQSPPKMVLEAESSALLMEEILCSEQVEGQGEASASDRESAFSVSKVSTELSQEQRDEIIEEKQDEEGVQVDNQSRQTGSRLHRLSRSRQKVSSPPTGNLQPRHSQQEIL